MKRITLTKYGFVRWPEEDFSDDGNRFQAYRAGKKVRVTKLVSNGEAYLSIDSGVGNRTLPYDVYKNLPHYDEASWKYNGVSVDSLTDEDLKNFYEACIAYEKEYEEAEDKIVYPTMDELKAKAAEITSKRLLELAHVEMLFKKYSLEAISKFSTYEWSRIQECTRHILGDVSAYNPDTYPEKIYGTSYSFDFLKKKDCDTDIYWYNKVVELFQKYNLGCDDV
jgi:hypothetical protein